jgi:3-oxoacyl-[acyl-carrier-protein] synthase-1
MMVTAVGACTAVGLNAASAAAAVRAGVSTFGMHPYMVDSEGDPVMVAQVPGIDPSSSATERMSVLACTALRDVLESRPPIWTAERVPVVLSLPSDRPGTDPQSSSSPIFALTSRSFVRVTPEGCSPCGSVGRL